PSHSYTLSLHDALPISTVECFDPNDGCRLILSPMLTARAGLHSPERHAFTRRDIRNLAPEVAAARPNFDVFRKSVHRNQMRKGTFDLRDQNVLATGRRRDAAKDRRATNRRLLAGGDIDRRKLTGEIVCKQIFVVRGLDHVFE